MKLVIKQYLASLKERGELDAVLPDLLSQMGLNVFLRPDIGNRQYGVDTAAYGKLPKSREKKIYLFCIKGGDLDRRNWDDGSPQSVRQSINEILDVFIPSYIPPEYKNSNIEICLCFGGDIKENIRNTVSNFTKQIEQKHPNITISEWNGDRLSSWIERYLLSEDLLPKEGKSLLRKSLAMVNEPEVSHHYFKELILSLTCFEKLNIRTRIRRLRQICLCLWILYGWSRNENNFLSIMYSSKFTILQTWNTISDLYAKKEKSYEDIRFIFLKILHLNAIIMEEYIENKITPYTNIPYGLSHAVQSSNSLDINLKLFDILSELALYGCWLEYYKNLIDGVVKDENILDTYELKIRNVHSSIIKLIQNNPILFTPYKEEQVIDLALVCLFLLRQKDGVYFVSHWIQNISKNMLYMFRFSRYPSIIATYEELLSHPLERTEKYMKEVTPSSVLWPYLALISSLIGDEKAFSYIQDIVQEFLSHCDFQLYFFDDSSERHFYQNDDSHGSSLTSINLNKDPNDFLNGMIQECKLSNQVMSMSATKFFWPVILLGCKYHKLPIPINFILAHKIKT